VAGDVRFQALREMTPTIYLPWEQGGHQGVFALRTEGPLQPMLPSIRRVVQEAAPRFDIWKAGTIDDYLAPSLATPRLSSLLLSSFGLVALLLCAIGLFGVMAAGVRERTRELGIRMVLGAGGPRIRREVLREAAAATAVGVTVGLAAALAGSRFLAVLLFEVSPADPSTLAGAVALLVFVALASAYWPARRAIEIDPSEVLRSD
jgi:ABC-type antimicrobial peptide transport system permease subunit